MSNGDSVVHSPRKKPRRRLTRKEKGKKNVLDSGTDRNESDRRESDSEGTGDGSKGEVRVDREGLDIG